MFSLDKIKLAEFFLIVVHEDNRISSIIFIEQLVRDVMIFVSKNPELTDFGKAELHVIVNPLGIYPCMIQLDINHTCSSVFTHFLRLL